MKSPSIFDNIKRNLKSKIRTLHRRFSESSVLENWSHENVLMGFTSEEKKIIIIKNRICLKISLQHYINNNDNTDVARQNANKYILLDQPQYAKGDTFYNISTWLTTNILGSHSKCVYILCQWESKRRKHCHHRHEQTVKHQGRCRRQRLKIPWAYILFWPGSFNANVSRFPNVLPLIASCRTKISILTIQ